MIGNVGSPCEEDATLTDFTSGCNFTVEASQVLPLLAAIANMLLTYISQPSHSSDFGGMSGRRFGASSSLNRHPHRSTSGLRRLRSHETPIHTRCLRPWRVFGPWLKQPTPGWLDCA